jgi:CRISPR-associated protein Cmr2
VLFRSRGEESRRQAQEALDARKRLRDFKQVEEPHLKCTLCGQRQELSGKEFLGDARRWWAALSDRHRGKIRVRENERLCAVCAVKRAALMSGVLAPAGLTKVDRHFPSTSGIAAATFKRRLLESGGAREELEAYFKALRETGVADDSRVDTDSVPRLAQLDSPLPSETRGTLLALDGDMFYVETFAEQRLKKEHPSADAEKGKAAADRLRQLHRVAGARPSKYFAALKMDGDRMGEFFAKASEEQARALSLAVSSFSRKEARDTVVRHSGRLVYAGGDDAFALLPLDGFLPCARELQEGFKRAVSGVETPAGLRLPTPSAGVAIAHHTAPLDLTLRAMQHAEKAAKNTYSRDALCVHVVKRSGEEVHIGTRWTHPDGRSLVAIAERAAAMLRDDADVLSMKFPYSVASEARALTALPREAREAELKRLTRRHKGDGFDEGAASELAAELAEWSDAPRGAQGEEASLGLEEVAGWLLLARFIASGGRDEE